MPSPNSATRKNNNKNKSGNNYEIEFPIPELEKDKIETLVELFAQSEAERIF